MPKARKSAKKPQGSKKWAGSVLEAARALGVSRQTLHAWVNLEDTPGKTANGRFNLDAWRKWRDTNKEKLAEEKAGKVMEAPVLSRKQEIALELAEIDLRKQRRLEMESEGKMMETDAVDALIFEVLANFDFHLSNAERDIALKVASKLKVPPKETRKIVKPVFDSFRYSFRDQPLSAEAKRHINAWLALPDKTRAEIIAGKLPAKGKE